MADDLVIPQIQPEEYLDEKKDPAEVKEDALKKSKFKISLSPRGKKILTAFGVLFLILLIISLIIGFLSYSVYQDAQQVRVAGEKLVAASQEQNLNKIKTELDNTKTEFKNLQSSYKRISWLKAIPFLGVYIEDGEHALNATDYALQAADIIVVTIEPYADIIGFSEGSDEAESGEETTQDRIDFVIKTIPDLVPKADELSEKVSAIKFEVDEIDETRYPEEFAGIKVRSQLERGKDLVNLGAALVSNGKPLLEAAPHILGTKEPRTYLILFQNDKELRPTGGFLTAYAIAAVEKGKFDPVSSNDIYNIDINYTPNLKASDPIVKYLKGPYLISRNYRLRDLNWSPDFSESMELFLDEAKSVGINDVDGVIAVDTQLLVNLLDAIGPIGVPGFGDFSTEIIPECNCPQVIWELESFADVEGAIVWSQDEPGKIIFAPPNIDNRKKIIGPLMNSILANALGQPKDKLPALFEAAFKSLLEKHVLFYVHDDESQKALEDFGIAGIINRDFEGDYLHINDANLGGRKSNLYVTQEVEQVIDVAKDGTVEKTVTITYNNPEPFDGWLNSVLPNYVRIYVPKGSELIDFEGVEDKADPYEEFDKTVYAGFFELRPQGIAKVTVKYKLPFKVTEDEYKLLVQKQPGKDAPLYTITIGKKIEELFLRTDKEFNFKI